MQLNTNNAVVARGSNITVADQPIVINELHGYAPAFSGNSVAN
jgi:hypothetical protein